MYDVPYAWLPRYARYNWLRSHGNQQTSRKCLYEKIAFTLDGIASREDIRSALIGFFKYNVSLFLRWLFRCCEDLPHILLGVTQY